MANKKDKRSETSAKNGAKGGRPKGYVAIEAEKARAILVDELMKEWKPIVLKAIEQAKKGDASARAWLKDNGFGKALDNLALTDPDDVLKTLIINKSHGGKRGN